jgi:hypothetical protein
MTGFRQIITAGPEGGLRTGRRALDAASRTLNARPGFPCDRGVKREPVKKLLEGK